MSVLLASLAREGDGGALVWVVVFIVGPLVLRLGRFLLERMGALQPGAGDSPEEALERRRRLREAQREAEQEGRDLWRRLARGEESAPPPVPPVPKTAVEPAWREASREDTAEPAPLSTLGTVTEPSSVVAVSLETAEEPSALGVLDQAASEAPVPAPARTWRGHSRSDWRHALVLADVLAPPVAERAPRPGFWT